MKRMTQAKLEKEFSQLNEQFFESRLTEVKVRFGDSIRTDAANGVYNYDTNTITIDRRLSFTDRYVAITLIHEMVHADMLGYKGYPADGGHGMLFQARLVELFKLGAYDGLI